MKYKKKPIVIEADVFSWGMEDGILRYNERIPREVNEFHPEMTSKLFPGYLARYDTYNEDRGFNRGNWIPYISTPEGDIKITEGDFIITRADGARYPCKPDIFEKTYEKVD